MRSTYAETLATLVSPPLAAEPKATAARLIEKLLMSPDKDSGKWLTQTLLDR